MRGWKLGAAGPNGDWVILLDGRSRNGLMMLDYAKSLLAAGYRVAMMDARANGSSDGAMATYGHLERYDTVRIVDVLESGEKTIRHLRSRRIDGSNSRTAVSFR